MAFYANGFKTISHTGTPDGTTASMRSLHAYVSNDDKAAVIGSNYFLSIYSRLKVGDIILASLDIDGSPVLWIFMVTASSSTSVTIAAQTVT